MPCGNPGHLNAAPGTPGDLSRIALQNIEGATADGAQTTYTYFHRFQTKVPTWSIF
jgi:hypothetical protein